MRGKGRGVSTYAHLSILICAAEYLSPKIHALVIKEFIEGRILEYRDSSGDNYKLLNRSIESYLPDAAGKYLYIEAAKAVRKKINPKGDGWNQATSEQLSKRDKMEDYLCQSLRLGVIQNKDQLMDIIDRF